MTHSPHTLPQNGSHNGFQPDRSRPLAERIAPDAIADLTPEAATAAATEAAIGSTPAEPSETDPLGAAARAIAPPAPSDKGVHIVVHGHFYQPPRENPYLEAIARQPSAAPFHDWNERIHHECYRRNAFARLCDDRGQAVGIVNNFEYISFNIGPTLMSWMERHDLETYQRIREADRRSCERLDGHGNAIAQVYNHIILPLANERDKRTQVRWGIADFRKRFGRDPEGIWLAETATDRATLEVLADEGIRFTILAPTQAHRCRPFPTADGPEPDWLEVGGGQIDPTRPYRCFLPRFEGDRDRYLDLFFYDGPISGDMGFSDALKTSGHFALRLGQAVRADRDRQAISLATDGETFGHHKADKEKCLAYAVTAEFPERGWTPSNFAYYLSLAEPTWEVEIKPVTAWSCSHGVDRWQDDCGCGGGDVWHQKWRRPLRDSLNWLRDRLAELYEDRARNLLRDPWAARDGYIQVVLDRSDASLDAFFDAHQRHPLDAEERTDALRLLEMQRHALLMFTSCGWFFEEISRPEGVQILRYASRAIELAAEVSGTDLERDFLDRLEAAPSNVQFGDGAEVYRQLVATDRITLDQVAAHYAISSLFAAYPRHQQVYCYQAKQFDYQLQRMGSLSLAVGQLQLRSDITREGVHYTFAVLHLGGWDFHCCIEPFKGRLHYSHLKEKLLDALQEASAAKLILTMNRAFSGETFGLQDLFAEERHRIVHLLAREPLSRLDRLYDQVYRGNYGVLAAFHRDELAVPQELQVAAEIALGNRVLAALRLLEADIGDGSHLLSDASLKHLVELEAIAAEADRLHCRLNLPEARELLQRSVLRLLRHLARNVRQQVCLAVAGAELGQPAIASSDPDAASGLWVEIECVERLVGLGEALHLDLWLDAAQEFYFRWLHEVLIPASNAWAEARPNAPEATVPLELLRRSLQLGPVVKVAASDWLAQLP